MIRSCTEWKKVQLPVESGANRVIKHAFTDVYLRAKIREQKLSLVFVMERSL